MMKLYPTLGCCGKDCGLCPRYYAEGNDRCTGCAGPDFISRHLPCSIINCCVKKNGYNVCTDCFDFPCPKLSENKNEKDRMVQQNLKLLQDIGMVRFLELQNIRIKLLETILAGYDDGSSREFYCSACSLLSIQGIAESLQKAANSAHEKKIAENDIAKKSEILKEIILTFFKKEKVDSVPGLF
jgi:hypothetical protein